VSCPTDPRGDNGAALRAGRLITLLEVILGPIWVWLVLSERPDTATLAGGAVIMLAVVIQVSGDPAGQAEVEAEIGTP
jgi:drug/metabolite transporter (DMT)-like permease